MKRSPKRARRHCRQHRFSLLEILVAMFILTVMMLMLMGLLVASQRVWSQSNGDTQVFENARIAMDVITRDLRSMVIASTPGRRIEYYVAPQPDRSDSARALHTCFVASIDPPIDANSQMCEVSYSHHVDPTPDDPSIPPFTLCRQVVTDRDTANWDFFNAPANWHVNDGGGANRATYETVVGGVDEVRITFYDANDRPQDFGQTYAEMPSRIEVTLILFDERLLAATPEKRLESRRAFTFILRPGDLRTEY